MVVDTENLGLAAFMKMHGAVLQSWAGRRFTFDTNQSEDEWQKLYLQSESHRHDVEVLTLRNLVHQKGRRT